MTSAELSASYRRAFATRSLWLAGTIAACAAAPALFLARLVAPDTPRAFLLAGAVALFLALFLVLLRRSLRRLPTEDQCRALLDSASRAGGLLLCADLPGADAWPRPDASELPPPLFRPARPLRVLLPAGLALCAAALLLSRSVFRSILPPPPPPGLAPLVAQQEEKIEDLLARDILTPEEAEPLREWLESVAASAASASDPALLEALDHLAETLDQKALPAESASAAGILPGDASTPPLSPQTDSLSPDAKKLLDSLSALDPSNPLCSTGDCGSTKEALEKLLQEAKEAAEQCAQCQGQGEGGGEGEGTGEGSGSGDVGKGPGHAPLSFGDPASTEGVTPDDHALRSSAPGADLSDTTLIGITASEPGEAKPSAPSSGGALAPAGAADGTAHPAAVLPRHKEAVKAYFSAP